MYVHTYLSILYVRTCWVYKSAIECTFMHVTMFAFMQWPYSEIVCLFVFAQWPYSEFVCLFVCVCTVALF